MHKLSVLAILLVAILAIEARPSRRSYYSRRISRPQSRPFTTFDARNNNNMGMAYPLNNYISMPGPMQYNNFPMQFASPLGGLRGRLPDGEYRTAYGIATVDGSDVNMDAY